MASMNNVYELEQKVQDLGRSISDNLGQLERRIQNSVESVRHILRETKDVFQDVKDGLKLTERVEKHPLSMLGLSIVAGIMVAEKTKSASPYIPHDLY